MTHMYDHQHTKQMDVNKIVISLSYTVKEVINSKSWQNFYYERTETNNYFLYRLR